MLLHQGCPPLLLLLGSGASRWCCSSFLALQLLQQHPRLGKAFVGPVDHRHQRQGGLQQHGCVIAGHR